MSIAHKVVCTVITPKYNSLGCFFTRFVTESDPKNPILRRGI